MIKDITIGQYLPGDSLVHKLDPRVKISITFTLIIVLFIINNFWGYIPPLLFRTIIILKRIIAKSRSMFTKFSVVLR
jgi:energy-coupling factor transport system permease protein